MTRDDLWLTALTIFGEARGSTQQDRLAIGYIIRNRAEARSWYGRDVSGYPDHTPAAVTQKPWQFSCWNHNDPNRTTLDELNSQGLNALQVKPFRACLKAAVDALDGHEPDPTEGSTHYVTTALLGSGHAPEWAEQADTYRRIGSHTYFHNVG